MRSQWARTSGSRAGRLARMGNDVAGRFRVPLKSGPPLLLIGASPSMRAAQSSTRIAARSAVNPAEIETPFLADAAVTAAQVAVHVVDERALFAVLEEDADDTGAAGDDRGHDLHDCADA